MIATHASVRMGMKDLTAKEVSQLHIEYMTAFKFLSNKTKKRERKKERNEKTKKKNFQIYCIFYLAF